MIILKVAVGFSWRILFGVNFAISAFAFDPTEILRSIGRPSSESTPPPSKMQAFLDKRIAWPKESGDPAVMNCLANACRPQSCGAVFSQRNHSRGSMKVDNEHSWDRCFQVLPKPKALPILEVETNGNPMDLICPSVERAKAIKQPAVVLDDGQLIRGSFQINLTTQLNSMNSSIATCFYGEKFYNFGYDKGVKFREVTFRLGGELPPNLKGKLFIHFGIGKAPSDKIGKILNYKVVDGPGRVDKPNGFPKDEVAISCVFDRFANFSIRPAFTNLAIEAIASSFCNNAEEYLNKKDLIYKECRKISISKLSGVIDLISSISPLESKDPNRPTKEQFCSAYQKFNKASFVPEAKYEIGVVPSKEQLVELIRRKASVPGQRIDMPLRGDKQRTKQGP